MWNRLIDPGTAGTADSIVDASGVTDVARSLAETQFVAALRQQQVVPPSGQQPVAPLWPNIRLVDVLNRRIAAENAAVPRDSAGMPGDERAHWYARVAADKADTARRLSEDLLFVGQQGSPKTYDKLARVQEADDSIAWTNQVMNDASGAFRVRDEILAEGPYVAEWLCDPLSAEIPDRDKLINSKLVPLFHGTHDLGKSLNGVEKLHNPEYLPAAPGLLFRSQTDRVRIGLDSIRETYDTHVKELGELESGEAAEWRNWKRCCVRPLSQGQRELRC